VAQPYESSLGAYYDKELQYALMHLPQHPVVATIESTPHKEEVGVLFSDYSLGRRKVSVLEWLQNRVDDWLNDVHLPEAGCHA
jgi:hypothetical protein